jgi:hypothetical protein
MAEFGNYSDLSERSDEENFLKEPALTLPYISAVLVKEIMGAFYEVQLKKNPDLVQKVYSNCTSLPDYDVYIQTCPLSIHGM